VENKAKDLNKKEKYKIIINKGLWSSGYDVSFTERRSPVQIWPGPLKKKKTKTY
jgi:hypothetical protein